MNIQWPIRFAWARIPLTGGSVPFRNVTNNLFNTLYVRFNKRLNQSGKLRTNPKPNAFRLKSNRIGGALMYKSANELI